MDTNNITLSVVMPATMKNSTSKIIFLRPAEYSAVFFIIMR